MHHTVIVQARARLMAMGMTVPHVVNSWHIRKLAVVREIMQGQIPELVLHERKLRRRSDTEKLYITGNVREGVQGFQCFWRCTPQDLHVAEVDATGKSVIEYPLDGPRLIRPEAKFVQCIVTTSNQHAREVVPSQVARLSLAAGKQDFFTTTVQRVVMDGAAYRAHVEPHISELPQMAGFCEVSSHLGQQDAYGNDYRAVFRRIPYGDQDKIRPAMRSLETYGFLNYFPPSTFNALTRTGKHLGLHLLKDEHRAAATLLLGKYAHVGQDYTGNFEGKPQGTNRLSRPDEIIIPRASRRALMKEKTLILCEESAAEILQNVFTQQQIAEWTNEFSHLLWNMLLSLRIHAVGSHSILPGDVVLTKDGGYAFASERQIESGELTPFDVVQPVPGTEVSLPKNEVSILYERVLAQFGFRSMDELCCQKHNYNVPGSYRKILQRPEHSSYKVVDDGQDLRMRMCFRLPMDADPSMLVRELCKMEGNTPRECHIVTDDGRRPQGQLTKERHMTGRDKETFDKFLSIETKKKYTTGTKLHHVRLQNAVFGKLLRHEGGNRWNSLRVGKNF